MNDSALNISRKALAKNSLLNLIGYIVPLVIAIIAFPIIIRGLGTDRFGILTIIWVIVGYFTIFDLGISRALTHHLSLHLSNGEEQRNISSLIWTCLLILFCVGIAGTLLGLSLVKPLAYHILNIPDGMKKEFHASLIILCWIVPCIILTSGLRGILSSYHRFDLINAIQIPLGIMTLVGPLIVLPFSTNLVPITIVLVITRLFVFLAYIILIDRIMPFIRTNINWDKSLISSLFFFGGWMSVSNMALPFLVYTDRFLIGAMASMSMVAYYTTPYEVITKLSLIPSSLGNVLFPTFSQTFKTDKERARRLFISGAKYIFILIFPIVFVIFTFAPEGLSLWLGQDFALKSAKVLRWLCCGVFLNCLGIIFINFLHGIGRPDLPAKVHLLELPVYVILLYFSIKSYGIPGAAMMWFLRVSIDAVILFLISAKFLSLKKSRILQLSLPIILSGILLVAVLLFKTGLHKFYYMSFVLLLFIAAVWNILISSQDRSWIKNSLRNLKS